MKKLLLFLLLSLITISGSFSQNIYSHVPSKVDTSKKYIIYLHGRIIEDQGINAVSEKYGPYEYEKILQSLAKKNICVISETRPKDTEMLKYAPRVAAQVDSLLKLNVPIKNITVIGASKGAGIAAAVSAILKKQELKFVVMAICNDELAKIWKDKEIKLWGRVLYIYDIKDEIAGSCKAYLDFLAGVGLKEYKEIRVELGLGHGILYSPYDEWVVPALEWALK